MNPPTKRLTVVTGILGIWLLVSPFVLGAASIDRWNDIVVGGVITTLSGYNYSYDRVRGTPSHRIAGILVLLGGWLLVAPFVIEISGILLWNDVTVGVVVTAFAMYNVYVASVNEQLIPRTSADET